MHEPDTGVRQPGDAHAFPHNGAWCEGLTKREWLMAHAPVDPGMIIAALGLSGHSPSLILSQDSKRAAYIALSAAVAREWADAILREASHGSA